MRVCDLNDSLANSVDLSGEYCESSCYLSDDALSDQSNDSREVGGEAYGAGVKEQDYSSEHYSRKNGSKLLAKSGERPFSSHFEVLLDDDED